MNKFAIALCSALLIAHSASALAASSTELAIKGLITPSACTPTLSSSGVIDLGKISASDLDEMGITPIGKRTLQMNVTCEAQTLMALSSTDNRAGSAYVNGLYGLGLINGDQKLGYYDLTLMRLVADSIPAQVIWSADKGATWENKIYLMPGTWVSAAALGGPLQPIPVKEMNVDVDVGIRFAPAAELDLSNEVPIDGSTTLDVMYL